MKKMPMVRFCACAREPRLKKGAKVYLKAEGVLTLNAEEAVRPQEVGTIDARLRLQLAPAAEKALAAA